MTQPNIDPTLYICRQAFEDTWRNSDTGPWGTFDATTEIPAVADWVRNGGGLVSLSGYSGDPCEVNAKNALFAFAGISYNTDRVAPPCPGYQICACSAGASPITDWVKSDPIVDKQQPVTIW